MQEQGIKYTTQLEEELKACRARIAHLEGGEVSKWAMPVRPAPERWPLYNKLTAIRYILKSIDIDHGSEVAKCVQNTINVVGGINEYYLSQSLDGVKDHIQDAINIYEEVNDLEVTK